MLSRTRGSFGWSVVGRSSFGLLGKTAFLLSSQQGRFPAAAASAIPVPNPQRLTLAGWVMLMGDEEE